MVSRFRNSTDIKTTSQIFKTFKRADLLEIHQFEIEYETRVTWLYLTIALQMQNVRGHKLFANYYFLNTDKKAFFAFATAFLSLIISVGSPGSK